MVNIRNPWHFQDLVEEIDRMTRDFSRVFDAPGCLLDGPETGLRLEEDAATVELELPGVTDEDLSLALEDNRIRIEARRADDRKEGEDVVLRERSYGEFSREYRLPWPVRPEDVEANFTQGILRVRLPRAPEAAPRRIPVKVN